MGEINPFPGPHTLLRIPNKMVGLIIGKNGETVKTIHQKTGCYIFIPKDSKPGEDYRELELSGPEQSVEICKREIISMIHLALYGRLPYQNSLFYPYIDPTTGLPIIDPGIMAQLDPNSKKTAADENEKRDSLDLYENNISGITYENNNLNSSSIKINEKDLDNYNEYNINSISNSNSHIFMGYDNNLKEKDINDIEKTDNLNINNIYNPNISNDILNNKQQTLKMQELEYKYAPIDINANYVQNQHNYFNPFDTNYYNLGNYNDQSNYDLYYQSLYQMYPQMSDYYKKSKENLDNNMDIQYPNSNSHSHSHLNTQYTNKSFVFYNTNLLEDNVMYDPSKINTNLLDVNFQNKINFSADQYFEGKMFDQNYNIITMDLNNNDNDNINDNFNYKKQLDSGNIDNSVNSKNNNNNDNYDNNNDIEICNDNNNKNKNGNENKNNDLVLLNNNNHNHNENIEGKFEFEAPSVPEKKRKSRFDR